MADRLPWGVKDKGDLRVGQGQRRSTSSSECFPCARYAKIFAVLEC